MPGNKGLYEKVVGVTYKYLGPASERFVTRIIQNHLNKKPQQLRQQDMKDLIDWFTLAMSSISDDPKMVKQYEAELVALQAQRS